MTTSTAARDPDLDHKFTGKHSLTIEVTEQSLFYQVAAAIERGGCNYWAEINVHKHERGWANYFTATFKIHERSDEAKGLSTDTSRTSCRSRVRRTTSGSCPDGAGTCPG